MKNIGLIISSLQGGGAERCAADLSIYFSQRGYQVYIITDITAVKYEYCGELINFVFSLSSSNNFSVNPLENKVNELREIKKKCKIDISISFMQFANYINILSKEEEKIILTTHSLTSEYAKYENSIYWKKETFQDLYQYADLITFPSEYCRRDWIEHYGDVNHITRTIYNPVHLMETDSDCDKENVVISIGRMQGIKRQWHLLKVFKLVKEKCPDAKLIILGDGELRKKLEELVSQLELTDSVSMPGNVSNVQDYLRLAKVFTITSRCEAMPCAVLEAMSAGVPVIACDIPGGIREQLEISVWVEDEYPIRGECGIITPYILEAEEDSYTYEEQCLADEIVKLLEKEDIRKKLGQNAKERAEAFTAEKIGEIWINDVFAQCLERPIDQEGFLEMRDKHFKEYAKNYCVNEGMHMAYYRMLEKWMVLREQGKNLQSVLLDRKFNNIIIYGLGKMANHLLYDLKDSGINIICAIDKAAINKYENFPAITNEEEIPEADCIIVTPVYQYDSIKNMLEMRTELPIISLKEIIDECK